MGHIEKGKKVCHIRNDAGRKNVFFNRETSYSGTHNKKIIGGKKIAFMTAHDHS